MCEELGLHALNEIRFKKTRIKMTILYFEIETDSFICLDCYPEIAKEYFDDQVNLALVPKTEYELNFFDCDSGSCANCDQTIY